MRLVFTVVIWLLIAAQSLLGQQSSLATPDAIFYNGKIITVDAAFNIREAFAVKGDRIFAVGTNDQIRALKGSRTSLVDLRGHAVIPGLIDNHLHAYTAGLIMHRGVDLKEVPSLAEMVHRIRTAAANTAPGQTIYATMGWEAKEFPEKRPPTRQDLDQAAPNNPVVVWGARGAAFLNSVALKVLGVTRDANTIGEFAIYLTINKDASGEPTGAISGSPWAVARAMSKVIPKPTLAEQKKFILEIQKRQNALGLTSIRDLQLTPDAMRAYYELWREGSLTARVSMGLEVNQGDEDRIGEILSVWGVGAGFGDPWLRLDCIAEFTPGTYLREPFANQPGNNIGKLNMPEDKYHQAIREVNRHGWRPAIHVDGDKALDVVLDAFEAADHDRSIRDKRWVVEHIAVVQPDQMERMARLGVMVSAQIQPYAGAPGMLQRWGKERTERAVPMRELLDHHLIVSGGSDWPGGTSNPFVNIYFYVTRNTLEMGPVGVAQKISRAEALRVESIHNAYLTFEEKIKGSIEPDKLADFLILSDDILTVPEEQIRLIAPLATYVGGRKVFASPKGGF